MLLEEYGLIDDLESAARVDHGAIDWLCLPRFDSSSCFCASLGAVQRVMADGGRGLEPRPA